MDKRNEAIEHYLDRIREQIFDFSPADDFIRSLRQDLYEYEKNNPNCTERDLELQFGTPEEIAKDFLEDNPALQPEAVVKGKRSRNIIIIILVVALVGAGLFVYDLSRQRQLKATDVIIIEE